MRTLLTTSVGAQPTRRRCGRFSFRGAGLKASACVISAACATIAFSAAAQAAEIRYVSAAGSNKAKCTMAAPCRSLQRGINKTPAGGELRVLDSGFYGNGAVIDKSITISGGGETVSLGGPISIADAGATVVLRGLALNGGGGTGHGIHITDAAAVHIERSVVQGYPQSGIFLDGASAELFVADSIVRGNGGVGLSVDGSGATARVTVDNSRFENNASGLFVFGPVSSAINRSLSAGNGEHGFSALGSGGFMVVAQSTAANNGSAGYFAGGGATLTLESSVAHGNATGIWNPSGIVRTRGNNTVFNNPVSNVTGVLTPHGGV